MWSGVCGKECTEEGLVGYLIDNYEVTWERAAADVADLLSRWKEYGLIDG